MPTKLQTDASQNYCWRIKSDSAREYGKAYRAFLLGETAAEPTVPVDVAVMAAQNIRIHIKCLLD